MSDQTEWDDFLAACGSYGNLAELKLEMDRLYSNNRIAEVELLKVAQDIVRQFEEDHSGVFVKSFEASPSTHGLSTADDYFNAKSDGYLHNAEMANAQDDLARSNEEGWPESDTDIGDAS